MTTTSPWKTATKRVLCKFSSIPMCMISMSSSLVCIRLNDSGEIRVNKQVLVAFRIGKYEDEVLCDVVPMQAGHLLLGRPWQFDRRVKYDGFTNKYSFVLNQRSITLVPLTPQQVYEDQVRLQKESDQKKESEQKKKSERERERGRRKKERKGNYRFGH